MDPLLEQHEEYIQMVDQSGLPLWVSEYYWYGMSNPNTSKDENT